MEKLFWKDEIMLRKKTRIVIGRVSLGIRLISLGIKPGLNHLE